MKESEIKVPNDLAHMQNRYTETETILITSNFSTELNLKHSGFVKCSQLLCCTFFR